jgi:hypoxanthine phosphoribosyltransferase
MKGESFGYMITEEKIRKRVKELASQLERDYSDKNPIFIGILKGAFIFMADLIREISIPLEVDFLAVSSYGKTTESTGIVKIVKDLSESIEGRHVILVEDIVDTGLTLKYLYELILSRKPASLKVCVFLDKRERRKVDVPLHYVGFEVPDYFLVGYGLDYAEKFRHLKYIRALKPDEVIKNG